MTPDPEKLADAIDPRVSFTPEFIEAVGMRPLIAASDALRAFAPLAEIVREYLAELDNPSPDWAMRKHWREKMRQALKGEEG